MRPMVSPTNDVGAAAVESAESEHIEAIATTGSRWVTTMTASG